ncbi:MAG: DUF1579 domain-containing protein [Chitinophagaceae bacterium]
MKKISFYVCSAALLLAACNNTENASKENTAADSTTASTEKKAWIAVDSATEMKAWMDYSTPGSPHAMLANDEGEWIGQNTMWMSKDAPPATSTSTMTNKMILGGRYQMGTYKGDFMGMPFEGMSIGGYDNHLKKFFSTWFDNMGTGMMKMEGTWDSTTNAITYYGSMVSPANGMECEMKEIFTFMDANTAKMEMFGPDSKTGEQYKTMEILLTRKNKK